MLFLLGGGCCRRVLWGWQPPRSAGGVGTPLSLGGTVLSFAQPFPGCKSISVGVPQGLPSWVYIGHVQYYDYFFSCFSINQHSRAVNPPISWVCWDCVGMCVGISGIMGKTRWGSSGVCVKSRKPVWSWQYSELLLTTLIYLTLSENCCFTGSAVGPLSHQWFFAGHWFVFFFLRFQAWLEVWSSWYWMAENKTTNKLQNCINGIDCFKPFNNVVLPQIKWKFSFLLLYFKSFS